MSYGTESKPRVGFFTDTSICIGCKACEVACKEWNGVPDDPQGFTGDRTTTPARSAPTDGATSRSSSSAARSASSDGDAPLRWLMSSDVCKHCTEAACLDVCPTGAIFRTEYGTVVVQQDICNGCGYCVGLPVRRLDQREDDGRVWKCTLCYDRLKDDLEPACAKACPTDSIQFGAARRLRERARLRVERLNAAGVEEAPLYGARPRDGVGGFGAFFLLLDEPEVYGLPPDPHVSTRRLGEIWNRGRRPARSRCCPAARFAGSRR